MPNRILRDWTDSFKFDGIPAEAEVLFNRLIMKADDFGRYHAHPQLIKSGCFPLADDLRANTVSAWLTVLSDRKLVFCYTSGDRPLLAIINFGQRIRDDANPKFPAPDGKPERWLATDENAGRGGSRRVAAVSGLGGAGGGAVIGGAVGSPPATVSASGEVFKTLKMRLNELYRRKETDAWSYQEEHALAEIAQRPEAMSEFDHMVVLRRSMPIDDRKRFFPQSLYSLLSKWNETLDKARIQCPIKPANPAWHKSPRQEPKPPTKEELQASVEWHKQQLPVNHEAVKALEKRISEHT